MKAFIRAFVVLVLIVIVAGAAIAYSIARRGLSTRTEPSRVEAYVAHTMRRLATPADVASLKNPVEATESVLAEGLEHFADHCATCHANDGSGDTEIGQGLYPRAPDMRTADTQGLSDGELFSIIERGVRLTGMPAWGTGTPEGERASWVLVHFIRHVPDLTDEDIARMEQLNPKSPHEWREEEEARRFLAGEDPEPTAAPSTAAPHTHGGRQE